MKKIALILLAAVAVQFAVAQSAEAVMNRFMKQTGIEKFYAERNGRTSLVDAQLSVAGQNIPIKVTAKYPSLFRVEMTAGGQTVNIIVRDSVAWVGAAGMPAQRIDDKEKIAQVAPITDLFAMFIPSTKEYDMAYVEKQGKGTDEVDVLEFTKKSDKSKSKFYFNTASGMLEKVTSEEQVDGKAMKITMSMEKYGKFSDGQIEIPTSVVTKTPMGNVTIEIKNMELDYPTAAWMFAEPK